MATATHHREALRRFATRIAVGLERYDLAQINPSPTASVGVSTGTNGWDCSLGDLVHARVNNLDGISIRCRETADIISGSVLLLEAKRARLSSRKALSSSCRQSISLSDRDFR